MKYIDGKDDTQSCGDILPIEALDFVFDHDNRRSDISEVLNRDEIRQTSSTVVGGILSRYGNAEHVKWTVSSFSTVVLWDHELVRIPIHFM